MRPTTLAVVLGLLSGYVVAEASALVRARSDLPAAVYISGFVQTVAKVLKLDPSQVSKTYMRKLRETASGAKR